MPHTSLSQPILNGDQCRIFNRVDTCVYDIFMLSCSIHRNQSEKVLVFLSFFLFIFCLKAVVSTCTFCTLFTFVKSITERERERTIKLEQNRNIQQKIDIFICFDKKSTDCQFPILRVCPCLCLCAFACASVCESANRRVDECAN